MAAIMAGLLFALDQAGMWILAALGFRGTTFLMLSVLLGTGVICYEHWFMHKQMQTHGKFQQWLINTSLRVISRTHIWTTYVILAGLGMIPYGWIPGIIVHRTHPVRGGFLMLLVFNGIKTYLTALGCLKVLHSGG